MTLIGDQTSLYFLAFTDAPSTFSYSRQVCAHLHASVTSGEYPPMNRLQKELELYFEGKLATFETPFTFLGTPFQKTTWASLRTIPYGHTKSYQEIASAIGRPTAARAVANANAHNFLNLLVPCHRVIQADHSLGGYQGGLSRKTWLLQHERHFLHQSLTRSQ